jgi:hypothetical protein
MLTVRESQMHVLSQAMFEGWMETHLREFFPRRCSTLERPVLRQFIQNGIEKAKRYGFVEEPDICRYVDVMMVCGKNFDEDPQLPWASGILGDPNINSPSMRIELLHGSAVDYLRRIEHPEEFVSNEEPEAKDEEDEYDDRLIEDSEEDDPEEDDSEEDDSEEDDSEEDDSEEDDSEEDENAALSRKDETKPYV